MVSVYNLNGLIERLAQAETILTVHFTQQLTGCCGILTKLHSNKAPPYYTQCIAPLDAPLTALAA